MKRNQTPNRYSFHSVSFRFYLGSIDRAVAAACRRGSHNFEIIAKFICVARILSSQLCGVCERHRTHCKDETLFSSGLLLKVSTILFRVLCTLHSDRRPDWVCCCHSLARVTIVVSVTLTERFIFLFRRVFLSQKVLRRIIYCHF